MILWLLALVLVVLVHPSWEPDESVSTVIMTNYYGSNASPQSKRPRTDNRISLTEDHSKTARLRPCHGYTRDAPALSVH